MLIYLARHADAVEMGQAGIASDADRPLTDEGVGVMKLVGEGLRALSAKPEAIISSPLLRARQSAEILQGALEGSPPIRESELLLVGKPASAVIDWLPGLDSAGRGLLLVGHEPLMGQILSVMISGSPAARVPFRKGAIASVLFEGNVSAGEGILKWHISPDVLECLGQTG